MGLIKILGKLANDDNSPIDPLDQDSSLEVPGDILYTNNPLYNTFCETIPKGLGGLAKSLKEMVINKYKNK